MHLAALALSAVISALGLAYFIAPLQVVSISRVFHSTGGLYAHAAIRIAVGALFFVAAPSAHYTSVLRIFGALVVAAGIGTLVMGLERQRRLFSYWSTRGPTFHRMWACGAVACGVVLLYIVGL